MQTVLLQNCVLAAAARAALRGEAIELPSPGVFDPRFRMIWAIGSDGPVLAESPEGWLDLLRSRGTDACAMYLQGSGYDEPQVAFGGPPMAPVTRDAGGVWVVWHDEMDWSDRERPLVRRGGFAFGSEPPLSTPDLAARMAELDRALAGAGAFAEVRGEPFWAANCFDPARAVLGGDAAAGVIEGLPLRYLPASAPEAAERLIVACVRGWVFGAMGSWNDYAQDPAQGPETAERYDEVTDALYAAIVGGLADAVNSV